MNLNFNHERVIPQSLGNFVFTLVIVNNLHHVNNLPWLTKELMKKHYQQTELKTNDSNAKILKRKKDYFSVIFFRV
jgi:hypothetical protein